MASTRLKDKILSEISLLPQDKLSEVYNFLHSFRLGEETGKIEADIDLMSFSGSWKEMDNETFDDFLSDIANRRRRTFRDRRSNAAIID